MNTLQDLLKFARLHDWGRDAYIKDGKLYVYERYDEKWFTFTSMSKLRTWAGY